MIKTRSTYNLTYNLDLTFDTIIEIYVWQGDSGSRPLIPTYTITDTNPNLQATQTTNIANLIDDFIEFQPFSSLTTGLVNNPNALNVSIDRTVDGVTTTVLNDFGTQGYYSAIEGLNVGLPVNKILVAGDFMKANKTSKVLIPLNPDGSNVQIVSSPNNEINLDLPVATSTDTNDYFKAVWINCADLSEDTEIEITYNGETYLIEVIDECKYDPIDIFFVNKEGQLQSFTFFKERTESTTVTKETYQRTGVDVSSGHHQFVDYNINSRTKFKMNSGFVEESQNEVFKQMKRSQKVWQLNGSKFIPLNIETRNLEYLTTVKDKLIKYNVEFSCSFEDINTL
jgi:hypothetical protein